jgi:hypothetical protein
VNGGLRIECPCVFSAPHSNSTVCCHGDPSPDARTPAEAPAHGAPRCSSRRCTQFTCRSRSLARGPHGVPVRDVCREHRWLCSHLVPRHLQHERQDRRLRDPNYLRIDELPSNPRNALQRWPPWACLHCDLHGRPDHHPGINDDSVDASDCDCGLAAMHARRRSSCEPSSARCCCNWAGRSPRQSLCSTCGHGSVSGGPTVDAH